MLFGWMGQIRAQLAEQWNNHFTENHPEHFHVALWFRTTNDKRPERRVSDWTDRSDCAWRENGIMRLKHLGLKDTGCTPGGLVATLSKTLFSLYPNSPMIWTQNGHRRLHHSTWLPSSWPWSPPSPSLNEGAKLFNCLFYVSALLSTESSKKIDA